MLKLFTYLLLLFFCFSAVHALSLNCEFRQGTCDGPEDKLLFYSSNDLSGHIRLPSKTTTLSYVSSAYDYNTQTLVPEFGGASYNYSMCCTPDTSLFEPRIVGATENCGTKSKNVTYFTNFTNGRLSKVYNASHHNYKLCLDVTNPDVSFNLLYSSDDELDSRFYECLFKVSSLNNSHVSSCDRTFNAGSDYDFTVYLRTFTSDDTARCNADCTSKIDNRIYKMCEGINQDRCSNIPDECEGALLGSWVTSNLDNTKEIQCMYPWTNERNTVLSNETIKVTSDDNVCPNLVTKKYSTLVNNEFVTMNIYVCED